MLYSVRPGPLDIHCEIFQSYIAVDQMLDTVKSAESTRVRVRSYGKKIRNLLPSGKIV